jgi:hypothetical protein
MSTTFLQQVRNQTWYPQVEAAMANAGVPEALWVSVIESENPSAVGTTQSAINALNNPVPDPPGFSYGLFQFHNQPAMVDPVASGNQAASIMGKALQSLPSNATPQQQLTAIEIAAWPGNDPALIAKENPQRAANLQSILQQEQAAPIASIYQQSGTSQTIPWAQLSPWGGAAAAGMAAAGSNTGAVSNAVSNATSSIESSIGNAVSGAVSNITSTIVQAGVVAAQVAIALAIVAGGFALIATGGNE